MSDQSYKSEFASYAHFYNNVKTKKTKKNYHVVKPEI